MDYISQSWSNQPERVDSLIPFFNEAFSRDIKQERVVTPVGIEDTQFEKMRAEAIEAFNTILEQFFANKNFNDLLKLKLKLPGSAETCAAFDRRMTAEFDETEIGKFMAYFGDKNAYAALPVFFEKIDRLIVEKTATDPTVSESFIYNLHHLYQENRVPDLLKKAVQLPRGAIVYIQVLNNIYYGPGAQWKSSPWAAVVKTEAENSLKRYEEKRKIIDDYQQLVGTYHDYFQRIKNLSDRSGDPRVSAQIDALEDKRHNTHLQLLEMGKQIGKDKNNVLVDIIREQKTLQEYDLPEFSILRENDILQKNDWYAPYEFNVDTESGLPGTYFNPNEKDQRGSSVIPEDKCMIVFSIAPCSGDDREKDAPVDFYIREKRAEALAERVRGEVFSASDSSYHAASASILGVIIPKKDLEKVAAIIRDNPREFRLGEQFYSDDEKKLITQLER